MQAVITNALLQNARQLNGMQDERTTSAIIPTLDGTYLIEVVGWVMLQKVTAGRYRLVIQRGTAYFYKPKGSKLIVAHHESVVRMANGRAGDLNGINYLGVGNETTQAALDASQPELSLGACYDIAVTFEPGSQHQNYVIRQQISNVDNEAKEYEVTVLSPVPEPGKVVTVRRSFYKLHRQVREDTRLTLVG
jgi:hypothetical protein